MPSTIWMAGVTSAIKLEDLDEATAAEWLINSNFADWKDNITIISAINVNTGAMVLPRMVEYNYTVVAEVIEEVQAEFYTFLNTVADVTDVAVGGDPVLTQYLEDNNLHTLIEYEIDIPCPANETFDECATDCFNSCRDTFENTTSWDVCPPILPECHGNGTCVCQTGFLRMAPDNITCVAEADCPHLHCPPGLMYDYDIWDCVDIDECGVIPAWIPEPVYCHANATCENFIGANPDTGQCLKFRPLSSMPG